DLENPRLRYDLLKPGAQHEIIEDIRAIKALRYWADDWLAETRFANVTKSIHVQCAGGIPDPVEETRWLQDFADRLGHPHGIVAEVHLAEPDAAEIIERHLEFANVRGVREYRDDDYLRDPAWERGFSLLESHGLVSCLHAKPETYRDVKRLAEEYPGMRLCLDHAGFPRARDDEYFELWRREITDLAEAQNVIVKVSGLDICDPRWTIDSLRPWVMTCIEAFGPERTIFASNWPFGRLFASYPDVIGAWATLIEDFSLDERTAMFSANAERYFRI
ncbi:MAG: amidohydrolase family protein, partial [Candidatus Limnocylindrales bacterium]